MKKSVRPVAQAASVTSDITPDTAPPAGLLEALRGLIQQGRQQALRAVDMVQVQTCWEIGRHIVEFEQQGDTRQIEQREPCALLDIHENV